jgi:hypothetical protein
MPINDDELEHAEEAQEEEEEGEMKWVIFFSFKTLMRVSFVHPRNGIYFLRDFPVECVIPPLDGQVSLLGRVI